MNLEHFNGQIILLEMFQIITGKTEIVTMICNIISKSGINGAQALITPHMQKSSHMVKYYTITLILSLILR